MATYKKLEYNGSKIQVQSAIEDKNGNDITSTYSQASLTTGTGKNSIVQKREKSDGSGWTTASALQQSSIALGGDTVAGMTFAEWQVINPGGTQAQYEAELNYAFAQGDESKAKGRSSAAFNNSTATGAFAFSEGTETQATNIGTHAEGYQTSATGQYAHAEGMANEARGQAAHTEGHGTLASGNHAHAEGTSSTAANEAAHAEGYQTNALGGYSHSEGQQTRSLGPNTHAEGNKTVSFGDSAHAEGVGQSTLLSEIVNGLSINTSTKVISFTSYKSIDVSGFYKGNIIKQTNSGVDSYFRVTATTSTSITVENDGLTSNTVNLYLVTGIAYGNTSHAEGERVTAANNGTHAEGYDTIAYGVGAHAEGALTYANGLGSHAEGLVNTTNGEYSHIEGCNNVIGVDGKTAHVEGENNIANYPRQHVQGVFNYPPTAGFIDIVGWGSDDSNRKNIYALDAAGNAHFAGNVYVGATDPACGTGTKAATETYVNNLVITTINSNY